MKKAILLFLLLAYTASSIGASVHLHYCCGKLDDISFSVEPKTDCAAREGDHIGCCDSEEIDLSIHSDQASAVKSFTPAQESIAFKPSAEAGILEIRSGLPTSYGLAHFPQRTVPLFIYICTFRI